MKTLLSTLVLFFSCAAFSQAPSSAGSQSASSRVHSGNCARCSELAALEKKVLEELANQEPNTAAHDVEAAKIINSMGILSDAQAFQILRYLKFTLPTDPSQAMIESLWPTISTNWNTLENAAKKLSQEDSETVWVPIQHYANSLKHGRDPARSTKKSQKQ